MHLFKTQIPILQIQWKHKSLTHFVYYTHVLILNIYINTANVKYNTIGAALGRPNAPGATLQKWACSKKKAKKINIINVCLEATPIRIDDEKVLMATGNYSGKPFLI